MQYQYTVDQNWEDYSAGRVLHNFPGYPAFPVRLASELFQQAFAYWQAASGKEHCSILDPCCGGAYHLTVLGLLHSERIARITAGDVDPKALELAELNLRLLTRTGFELRMREIEQMAAAFGKQSHQDALASARRILSKEPSDVSFSLMQADVLNETVFRQQYGSPVDIVFSDVPYGIRSTWSGGDGIESPLEQFLKNLLPVLLPESVVIIAADKSQKIRHPAYRRLEKYTIGKRQVAILQTTGDR